MYISKFNLLHKFFSSKSLGHLSNRIFKKNSVQNDFKTKKPELSLDQVNISSFSKKMLHQTKYNGISAKGEYLTPQLIKIFQLVPDVREEKVRLIKKKLENANYMKNINYERLFNQIIQSSRNLLSSL